MDALQTATAVASALNLTVRPTPSAGGRYYLSGAALRGASQLLVGEGKVSAFGIARRPWYNGSKDAVVAVCDRMGLAKDFPF